MDIPKRIDYLRQRIDKTETAIAWTKIVLYILIFFMIFFSIYMAEKWFAYDVIEEKTRQEAYEYPTGTVSTYICYTTTYGDHYHAKDCGSLWNSAYKTTVYQAEKRGYKNCSKCEPWEKTTLTLTETRYKDVKYEVSKKKIPIVRKHISFRKYCNSLMRTVVPVI